LGYVESATEPGLYTLTTVDEFGKQTVVELCIYVDDTVLSAESDFVADREVNKILRTPENPSGLFDGKRIDPKCVIEKVDGKEVQLWEYTVLGATVLYSSSLRYLRWTARTAIEKVLETNGMAQSKKRASTPITSAKLDEGAPLSANEYPYRKVVGQLNFIAVIARPDIAYAVSQLAQRCNKPTQACKS
jgi:hypothetical protein